MSWTSFFTILLMNLVGVASPGPDIILVTRYATKSRRHAIAAAAGIQIGVLFWCGATVFVELLGPLAPDGVGAAVGRSAKYDGQLAGPPRDSVPLAAVVDGRGGCWAPKESVPSWSMADCVLAAAWPGAL